MCAIDALREQFDDGGLGQKVAAMRALATLIVEDSGTAYRRWVHALRQVGTRCALDVDTLMRIFVAHPEHQGDVLGFLTAVAELGPNPVNFLGPAGTQAVIALALQLAPVGPAPTKPRKEDPNHVAAALLLLHVFRWEYPPSQKWFVTSSGVLETVLRAGALPGPRGMSWGLVQAAVLTIDTVVRRTATTACAPNYRASVAMLCSMLHPDNTIPAQLAGLYVASFIVPKGAAGFVGGPLIRTVSRALVALLEHHLGAFGAAVAPLSAPAPVPAGTSCAIALVALTTWTLVFKQCAVWTGHANDIKMCKLATRCILNAHVFQPNEASLPGAAARHHLAMYALGVVGTLQQTKPSATQADLECLLCQDASIVSGLLDNVRAALFDGQWCPPTSVADFDPAVISEVDIHKWVWWEASASGPHPPGSPSLESALLWLRAWRPSGLKAPQVGPNPDVDRARVQAFLFQLWCEPWRTPANAAAVDRALGHPTRILEQLRHPCLGTVLRSLTAVDFLRVVSVWGMPAALLRGGFGAQLVRLLGSPCTPDGVLHLVVTQLLVHLTGPGFMDLTPGLATNLLFVGVLEAMVALLAHAATAVKVGIPQNLRGHVHKQVAGAVTVCTNLLTRAPDHVRGRFRAIPGVMQALEATWTSTITHSDVFAALFKAMDKRPCRYGALVLLPVRGTARCSICMEGYLEEAGCVQDPGSAEAPAPAGAGAGAGTGTGTGTGASASTEPCVVTPCWHSYHLSCLRKWMTTSRNEECPECKTRILGTLEKMLTQGAEYSIHS
jgi:hypothetical protein